MEDSGGGGHLIRENVGKEIGDQEDELEGGSVRGRERGSSSRVR